MFLVAHTAGGVLPVWQQASVSAIWDWLPDKPGEVSPEWELATESAVDTVQPQTPHGARPAPQQTHGGAQLVVYMFVC